MIETNTSKTPKNGTQLTPEAIAEKQAFEAFKMMLASRGLKLDKNSVEQIARDADELKAKKEEEARAEKLRVNAEQQNNLRMKLTRLFNVASNGDNFLLCDLVNIANGLLECGVGANTPIVDILVPEPKKQGERKKGISLGPITDQEKEHCLKKISYSVFSSLDEMFADCNYAGFINKPEVDNEQLRSRFNRVVSMLEKEGKLKSHGSVRAKKWQKNI